MFGILLAAENNLTDTQFPPHSPDLAIRIQSLKCFPKDTVFITIPAD